MNLIVKALGLKDNQTVIDLGAGDGVVILEAAKKAFKKNLNTKFIAVEINPILIGIMHIRRLFNPNRSNILILKDDIFRMNYRDLVTDGSYPLLYIYISPWYIEKTLNNAKKQIKKFKVVSYMYPVKSMKARERAVKGLNSIFIYG
jgi:16S rRNA A1518/A1519 N6-dimethyltransferase RsmA/KsgA/DIM1 with predicted DNA glycosylase/AP lyase activity